VHRGDGKEPWANFRRNPEGGPILFLDEADALFGKRTEVWVMEDRFTRGQGGDRRAILVTHLGLGYPARAVQANRGKHQEYGARGNVPGSALR